ncbi:hypothetical protein MICA_1284 [Micavibrio aeruginosavorus ARL-13]|uniref:Uncharacterized protein n=1 Tax=Micavibrio aeruginosavorus (strain ARL-13) TaxID=856793 RepID=G2KSK6_MICAA|nr:hypothetical protein MICA_1284 [Micavibrio aeruginosavorus ARL-13]
MFKRRQKRFVTLFANKDDFTRSIIRYKGQSLTHSVNRLKYPPI